MVKGWKMCTMKALELLRLTNHTADEVGNTIRKGQNFIIENAGRIF